jgi:hypothetical protein
MTVRQACQTISQADDFAKVFMAKQGDPGTWHSHCFAAIARVLTIAFD